MLHFPLWNVLHLPNHISWNYCKSPRIVAFGRTLTASRMVTIEIRKMKNSPHQSVHTVKRHVGLRNKIDYSKRTSRLCWGHLERLNPHKEISPRLVSAGWRRLWISAVISFYFIFISTKYIILFLFLFLGSLAIKVIFFFSLIWSMD
jgi:hypothetical protein